MSERSDFIEACFALDLQVWYKEWIAKKRDRLQLFREIERRYQHYNWVPSNRCRSSGQILTKHNIDVHIGYWTPNLWFPIHKDLLKEHKRQEIHECQKIDCSCSDCVYFRRDSGNNGYCQKLEKKVVAAPNTACPQNLVCFFHRRDHEDVKQ